MTFEVIRTLCEAGAYKPVYVEVPQPVPSGFIFDENQSVVWNREQVREANEARMQAIEANRISEGDACRRFEQDVIAALQDEFEFSEPQAILTYNRAYDWGHSTGFSEVLSRAEDLAGFLTEFTNS